MRLRATRLGCLTSGGKPFWPGIFLNGIPVTNLTAPIALSGVTSVTNGVNGSYTFGGAISGGGPLVVNLRATSDILLNVANTFTGGIVINSGIVRSPVASGLNTFGTGGVQVNTGSFLTLQTWRSSFNGLITLNGGTLTGSTSSSFTNGMPNITQSANSTMSISGLGSPVLLPAAGRTLNINGFVLTLNCANTAGTYLPGAFAGGGTVNKTGTGLLLLQGASTSTCNLNIQVGAVTCAGAGCLGTSGTITVSAGATLNLGGFYTASGLAARLVNNGTVNA